MRLMIDANILLDVLEAREPYCNESSLIWKLCETDALEGHISTLSFANIIYVMRKELSAETISEVLERLSLIFSFDSLTYQDLSRAASLNWKDYEDAVQAAISMRIKADYIVTRNLRDYQNSKVPAVTPGDVLLHLKQSTS